MDSGNELYFLYRTITFCSSQELNNYRVNVEDGEVCRAILTMLSISKDVTYAIVNYTDLSIDLRKMGMSHCLNVLTCSKRDADIRV